MRLKHGINLTDREKALVRAIRTGKSVAEASGDAGYSIEAHAHAALESPQVIAVLEYELRRRLITRLVPLAAKHYESVLKDANASNADKNAAARAVMDRAGFVPPRAGEAPAKNNKDLGEMDSDELRAYVRQAEQELSSRATDITPDSAPEQPDDLDLY